MHNSTSPAQSPAMPFMDMKHLSYLIFLATVCLLSACSSETEIDPLSDQEIILTATMEGNDETRTTLDMDYMTVLWMPKENISVFRGGKMAEFTSTNTEKTPSAQFKGTLPEAGGDKVIYGLYPYSADASISKDVILTSIPAEQVAVAGTFDNDLFISIARTENYELGFFNVCSGIRFMLDRNDIQSVIFLSNGGEPLAGRISVGFDNDGKPAVKAVEEGSPEVRLSAPGGKTFEAGVWYYVVTLPVALEKGYTLLLEGENVQGAVRSSNAIALNRSKFRSTKLGASRVDYKKESDYDIVNAGVRAYLESVDYSDDPDYKRSDVAKFSGSDKPIPVKLSWEGRASVIRISTSPDLSDYREMKVDASPASVYNLIPGVRYFYSVLAADGTVLRESCVIPKGPMRMINGVTTNMRDLGGWMAGDKTIRYGKIYRGARLDDIQSKPSAKAIIFDDLGLSIDLDLRGLPPGTQGGSGEKNPWTSAEPIQYVNIQLWHYFVPTASQYDSSVQVAPGASAEVYRSTLRTILGWLEDGEVVYFHCHGGSDRTGTLAFLIEALMGVSENDLSKDYEVTYYSGSKRKRNGESGWYFGPMVRYLRTFAPGKTIQEQVTAWATTGENALTLDEIEKLKALLLE